MLQPSVRDKRVIEVELRQGGKVLQVLQPRVRDKRVVEV